MSHLRLYLASRSPRRLALLSEIGLAPLALPQDVAEQPRPGESPREMVARLARDKARSALADPRVAGAPGVVLGADTCVVVDGRILGQPRDADDALSMLRLIQGRTHEVLTGVFLARTGSDRTVADVVSSQVRFRALGESELRAYVATGEPLDKAGAYGLQGRGALLCAVVSGSWSNVVGLPLEPLAGWMERLGIDLASLLCWRG